VLSRLSLPEGAIKSVGFTIDIHLGPGLSRFQMEARFSAIPDILIAPLAQPGNPA
jgi:hypothetical protein